ncbi:hypothetical protein [Lachnospira eligens]|jgi:hypothetical protein|uniref:hypothetical protein n=1 Tax=Lachnospira eligens TaxID=39485 RepID=UPI000E519252|nr:hypothetical protein [Lachnospira eligens]RHK52092.1 hypothetical protein DW057_10945 [Lachnospira eligens]RHK83564.1 hypothetical protein DW044_12815 [Lachnospira eligens]
MYKDITAYNKYDKERKPSVLENNVGEIMFRVHKHIYYGEQWLLTCRELEIEQERLHTENMEEAKKLGIERMKELINKRIEKYQKALQSSVTEHDKNVISKFASWLCDKYEIFEPEDDGYTLYQDLKYHSLEEILAEYYSERIINKQIDDNLER